MTPATVRPLDIDGEPSAGPYHQNETDNEQEEVTDGDDQ